jgi:hypothetical protein
MADRARTLSRAGTWSTVYAGSNALFVLFGLPIAARKHCTSRWLNQVIDARKAMSSEISDAVWRQAKAERAARGGGTTMIHGPDAANVAADMQGFVTGEGLSADYAGALRISDNFDGLVYCSEKTYDMVAGVNFIVVNARTKISYFGLTGELLADTEFEPGIWSVEIGSDGLARQGTISREDFIERHREIYPDGYEGFGVQDPMGDVDTKILSRSKVPASAREMIGGERSMPIRTPMPPLPSK